MSWKWLKAFQKAERKDFSCENMINGKHQISSADLKCSTKGLNLEPELMQNALELGAMQNNEIYYISNKQDISDEDMNVLDDDDWMMIFLKLICVIPAMIT